MIIAVDTGNRCIKVPDITPFVAGVYCNGPTPPVMAGSSIYYKGNYYTLSDTRCTYMRDKTENENYFMLTLFAIARKICAKNPGMKRYDKEVVLALGLPLSHLSQEMKARYKAYFSNHGEPIEFLYNDIPFRIHIAYPEDDEVSENTLKDPSKCGVLVFAQGYAAAMLHREYILAAPETYIVDIGGYTTDVARVGRGKTNSGYRITVNQESCISINMGVIHLFNNIKKQVEQKLGDGLSEAVIDDILQGAYVSNNKELVSIIENESRRYAKQIVESLQDKGYRFNFSRVMFIGGGARVLQDYLKEEVPDSMFVTQLTANAEGYSKLARGILEKHGLLSNGQVDD